MWGGRIGCALKESRIQNGVAKTSSVRGTASQVVGRGKKWGGGLTAPSQQHGEANDNERKN